MVAAKNQTGSGLWLQIKHVDLCDVPPQLIQVSYWGCLCISPTVKDPESLQTEEEQQQNHIQNQIIWRVGE